uniref:Uncharacterized protein LOC114342800 n=1 Tax=Diabrotica virgifera virgifera TaxID=50390 RepID=A0A6P7GHX7_DIAVI
MNINRNLISLKCILFLVFGAIGSLFPFLPLHMNSLGLSKDESIVVSIVAPIIALIGPLVAAPLADRLAGTSSNTSKGRNGAYLRVMIAVSLAFATILYWLLLVIPPIKKNANVTFICNEEGGYVLQDRCGTNCYDWNTDKGSLLVKNCIYTCNETSAYQVHESTLPSFLKESHEATGSDSDSYYDGDSGSDVIPDLEVEVTTTPAPAVETATGIYFEPHPHMCYRNDTGYDLCEVYTDYSKPINFHIGLKSSVPFSSPENRTCKFPTFESFQCRIRPDVQKNLTNYVKDCKPIVICEIHNPYNNENSLLERSQCGNSSFWLYIFVRSIADLFLAATVVRSIADLFLAATVVLITTAVVIATRETSTGMYTQLNSIPLSPPEWWWHTRCGLLALPMSSVRKYGWEVASLGLVLFLLGVFWSAIDSFLPWCRCIGVVLGGLAFSDFNSEYVFQNVHKYFCVAAVVVAIIYFCLYHFYLKAYCIPPVHLPPAPAPALIQSMNGNGAYTPLRVYHNSKSKKGHFRY